MTRLFDFCGFRIFSLILAIWSASGPAGAFDLAIIVAGAPDKAVEARLRQASRLATFVDDDTERATQDILAAAQADYADILRAAYAEGFYAPVISIRVDGREAADLSPSASSQVIRKIVIRIQTGPRFRFGETIVRPIAPGTDLPDAFSTGLPAPSGVIADAAKAAVAGWRQLGHAKAGLRRQDIVADHGRTILDVRLAMSTGPRLRFGQVTVEGNTRVRPERIKRIAGIPEGRTFDPDDIEAATRRLRRTGTFQSVALSEGGIVEGANELPVAITVTDRKPRRIGAGIEVNAQEGAALSGFWLHRNLRSGAERLRLDAEVAGIGGDTGGVDSRFSTRFERPGTFAADVDLFVTTEIEREDEPYFFSRSAKIETGLSKRSDTTLVSSLGVGYRYSDVRDAIGARTFSHLILPAGTTWDRRDDILNTRSGTYLAAGVLPLIALDASSDTGVRATADARIFLPVGERIVLAGRGQLGNVFGTDRLTTPADLLFFSGGGGTVRGQPYQSLATILGGQTIGGTAFFGLSMELRGDVTDTISLVGFYDIGHIGAHGFFGTDGVWHSGAGIGLRYDTGIGPLRLDLGLPVNGTTGDGARIYVGVGQVF